MRCVFSNSVFVYLLDMYAAQWRYIHDTCHSRTHTAAHALGPVSRSRLVEPPRWRRRRGALSHPHPHPHPYHCRTPTHGRVITITVDHQDTSKNLLLIPHLLCAKTICPPPLRPRPQPHRNPPTRLRLAGY